MSDDLRDRWRAVKKTQAEKSDNLFSFWEDQKRMQAEDKKLEQDLAEAKKKAKELRRELYKNKFGESKISLSKHSDKLAKEAKVKTNKAWKLAKSRKKLSFGMAAAVLAIAVGVGILTTRGSNEVLGEKTEENLQDDGRINSPPPFEPLYPAGESSNVLSAVTRSTPSAEVIYTYKDSVGEIEVEVTQQKVPDNFDLEKAATDFQATSIIQVDDTKVYHGYSERGDTQSLIFIKDDKMVLIRSPRKLADDQWAAYVASLK